MQMRPFRKLSGIAAPIDADNVDTDQIIPSRFLMKPRAYDYGTLLFYDARFADSSNAGFVLNRPEYRDAKIIVGSRNFGCGSAREQAVYALLDYGILAVIAPSFGDIFKMNCVNNGILPAEVPIELAAALRKELYGSPGATVTIDLEQQIVVHPSGSRSNFNIEKGNKDQLLHGEDEISLTLHHQSEIESFERLYFDENGWVRLPNSRAVRA